jgi:hypothetical protein
MRPFLAILASTAWISVNEFLRNQVLLIDHWTGHYAAMGLTFPGEPLNGAVWGLWSFCFAVALFFLSRRFTQLETAALGWVFGFVLMWIVIGNLGILPYGILVVAVPWSLMEVSGAVWILKKIA